MRSMIGGIVLVALVSPALANEYWVEYNYSTHVCSVVEKKSADTAQDAAAAETTNAIAPNDSTVPDASQGANAAIATTDGAESGTPPVIVVPGSNDQTTSDAYAGNTTIVSGAPNATQGANGAKGGVSGAPNSVTAWSVPTDTGTGDNNVDPFKALAEAWARKKAAVEAAGTDTTKALIGSAMHSREEAEAEMQVMRKCGLRP